MSGEDLPLPLLLAHLDLPDNGIVDPVNVDALSSGLSPKVSSGTNEHLVRRIRQLEAAFSRVAPLPPEPFQEVNGEVPSLLSEADELLSAKYLAGITLEKLAFADRTRFFQFEYERLGTCMRSSADSQDFLSAAKFNKASL